MKYKLVIFDWQGTLTDVVGQFCKQFCHVASSLGLPMINNDKLNPLLHLDICTLVQTLFPEPENHTKRMRMVECFTNYRMHHGHDVCLYDGVQFLLERLNRHDIFIGIATAASQQTITTELACTGLSPLIDAYKTPDHTLCKPAPDMLNELMDELGVNKSETVMVGDSRCDFEAAQHANIDFIGIHMANNALVSDIVESSNCVAKDISSLVTLLN